MSDNKQEWSGKTGGGNFGQRFLFWALRRVNVVFLYPMLFFAIPFYCLAQRQSFRYIFYYFHQIHHLSKWTSFWRTLKNFILFGEVVLDKFAILAGNTRQFKLVIKNVTEFNQWLDRPEGIIVAGSHVGNFEMIGHCFPQDKKVVNCVIYGGESEVFKNQRNDAFNEHNLKTISFSNDLSHLFAIKEALERGEIITIACDRVWGSKKVLKVNFLGKETTFPLGPFMLAAQMNVPIAAVVLLKERRTRYCGLVSVFYPDDTLQSTKEKSEKLAMQYVHYLEKILKKCPDQWFNFFDFWGSFENTSLQKG